MEIPRAYFSNATVHRSLSPSPEDGILKPQVCMRIREEDYRKAIVRN